MESKPESEDFDRPGVGVGKFDRPGVGKFDRPGVRRFTSPTPKPCSHYYKYNIVYYNTVIIIKHSLRVQGRAYPTHSYSVNV